MSAWSAQWATSNWVRRRSLWRMPPTNTISSASKYDILVWQAQSHIDVHSWRAQLMDLPPARSTLVAMCLPRRSPCDCLPTGAQLPCTIFFRVNLPNSVSEEAVHQELLIFDRRNPKRRSDLVKVVHGAAVPGAAPMRQKSGPLPTLAGGYGSHERSDKEKEKDKRDRKAAGDFI
jgi:hypothetical protein